jgi:hypothetical protein
MTLLIRDQLTCPPTWFASYRDLTLYCAIFLKLDIVIESEDADTYYRWIKPRGGMDFIEDIIRPGSERGLHLDLRREFPRTIITDRIAPENVHRLIAAIRTLAA